jgi:hypothetical protein
VVGAFPSTGCMVSQSFAAGGNQSYLECWAVTDGPQYPGYITLTKLLLLLSTYGFIYIQKSSSLPLESERTRLDGVSRVCGFDDGEAGVITKENSMAALGQQLLLRGVELAHR